MRTEYIKQGKDPKKRSIPIPKPHIKIYNETIKILDEDTKKVVAVLLKNIVPKGMIDIGRQFIDFKRKGVRPSISGSDKPIWTTLVGRSFPRYIPPGYLSPASKLNLELFNHGAKVFMKWLERYYKKYVPEDYNKMVLLTKRIPKAHRIGGAWHSYQVNYDYRSRYHTDSHDASDYSMVVPFYDFTGGEVVIPAWNVAFKVLEGDLIILSQKAFHGNFPIKSGHRLSVIPYTHSGFRYYNRRMFFKDKKHTIKGGIIGHTADIKGA
jgi:hypothetical protein